MRLLARGLTMPETLESQIPDAEATEAERPSEGQRRRWFPVRCDMVEREEFPKLTVCEKLVLLDINYRLHEHFFLVECQSRQGPFFQSDRKWADRLRMSAETFQNARCKIGRPIDKTPKTPGLGWVSYQSGYKMSAGKASPTRYHDAAYATTQDGTMCGALWRQCWADLISALQRNRLNHADLVTFAMIGYWWKVCGGRQHGSIMIPKAEVKNRAGLSKATFEASLADLRAMWPQLLALQVRYRHFEITRWGGGPDAKISVPHTGHYAGGSPDGDVEGYATL